MFGWSYFRIAPNCVRPVICESLLFILTGVGLFNYRVCVVLCRLMFHFLWGVSSGTHISIGCTESWMLFNFINIKFTLLQVFLLHPPPRVQSGDELLFNISMIRSKENHRLMEIDLSCEIKQLSGELIPPFQKKFFIE